MNDSPTSRTTAFEPSERIGMGEYLVPLLGSLSLLVSCALISGKKYFWNDELFSYYLLADKSFSHMLVAFHDKINNSPPLYFLLGWVWAHIFGGSELSLRLFPSVSMCGALWLLWLTIRRTYGFYPASIGVLSIFCTSTVILWQNAEARMYGLFMAATALAFFLYDAACRKEKLSGRLLAGTILAHIALVNSHLFGLFYSGVFLLAFILTDWRVKRFRIKLYLAIVFSWLSLLAYLPSLLNQADAGKPRSYPPMPNVRDLIIFTGMSSSSMLSLLVMVALLAVAGLAWLLYDMKRLPDGDATAHFTRKTDSEAPLLIASYLILALPFFVWIISRLIKPIFYDRYMIPNAIAWAVLLAFAVARLMPFIGRRQQTVGSIREPSSLLARSLLLIFIAVLLAYPMVSAKRYWREPLPGSTDTSFGYPDLPIVVQESHDFIMRAHYSPQSSRYFFILDWPSAVAPASGIFGPEEYKQIEALGRNYPRMQRQIMQSDAFLAKYDRFLVLDYSDFDKRCPPRLKGLSSFFTDIHCPQWVEARLLHNPQYKVEVLGQNRQHAMLLVRRQ